jgi:hypothetical protein
VRSGQSHSIRLSRAARPALGRPPPAVHRSAGGVPLPTPPYPASPPPDSTAAFSSPTPRSSAASRSSAPPTSPSSASVGSSHPLPRSSSWLSRPCSAATSSLTPPLPTSRGPAPPPRSYDASTCSAAASGWYAIQVEESRAGPTAKAARVLAA